MELAMSSAIALLVFAGVYLVLRARSFDVILGLTLLSYGTGSLAGGPGITASGAIAELTDEVVATHLQV